MKIAVLGAGAVGSSFAAALARAGHDVTLIARGARLVALQGRKGIALAKGETVPVTVAGELDGTTPWDVVLVTVLGHQVAPVLPALAASSARRIVFMFNTFEPLAGLRKAVGAERFGFAFPSILATIDASGVLDGTIQDRGLLTTVTDDAIAELFATAKIRTAVEPDMESWLRAHVAAVVPFMLTVAAAYRQGGGIDRAEAARYADAMKAGFTLVEALGNRLIPAPVAVMSRLPRALMTSLLWTSSRLPRLRALGAAGDREPRALLDAMLAASPSDVPALARVRAAVPPPSSGGS